MFSANNQDLCWVAGLLEGEGCFTTKNRGRYISLCCHMTDLDVLQKLQKYVGGSICGPYQNTQSHHKLRYHWSLSSKDSYNLMKALLPHMCIRRKKRIEELLHRYENGHRTRLFEILEISTGKIHVVENLKEWCKAKDLNSICLYKTMKGTRNHHKGYRRIK